MDKFFIQAIVYLAAAVISVPIAKRLGLGSVLGYLLAGIAIGPYILGLVGAEGQDIMHFAEFGVVMMLFVIGLELEPELLWRLRISVAGMGSLQVVLTTLLVFGLAVLFGLAWQSALALGMIMALSSTAIVMQSLNEKGLMKTAAGESSFSVLLFQDIAVIPMLAVFPLLGSGVVEANAGHGSSPLDSLPGWLKTLSVIGSVAVIILAGKYLLSPIFRLIAKAGLREVFTAAALLLVISIAALMTMVGLSPALGTFVAGVVLANSEYRHELESDIEPFKGLLLGLFFISVGASIDFGLIFQNPLLVLGLLLLLFTVKIIVLLITGRIFKLSMDQNLIFGFALSQVGEFAFVLFSFALQQNIMGEFTIKTMVAVVALSMAATPLIMLLNEKFLQPIFGTKESDEREADDIEEKNKVIIAGFDKFGNIVGRLLRANGVHATLLDNDSDRVDVLRKLGFKVYYGDATRHDLLHSAGASHANILVAALDSPERNIALIETALKHFPQLKIYARAFDRGDAYDMMELGVKNVYRETVDTSLRMGADILTIAGHRAYSAHRAMQKFLRHDEKSLEKLAEIRKDNQEYLLTAKRIIEELEEQISADLANPEIDKDKGWDAESLIQEFNSAKWK